MWNFPYKWLPFSHSLVTPSSMPLSNYHLHFTLEGFSSFSENQREHSFVQNPSLTYADLAKVTLTSPHGAHYYNYCKMTISREDGP